MKLINRIELPTFAVVADNSFFEESRQAVLDSFKNWEIQGRTIQGTLGSKVTKLDYFLDQSIHRPYADLVHDVVDNVITIIHHEYDWPYDQLRPTEMWMQTYSKGDYHGYHGHPHSTFNCVWYVELPEDGPVTTLLLPDGTTQDIKVKQGDVLIFPAQYVHTSSENMSEHTKTILAFNI
jgi:oxalate decarboxylase/phosphoglucose isomerase-like protein (cupin superfamily)